MCEVTEEDLADEFSTFDVNLSSPDVIDKLIELCQLYRLDAAEMAVEWVAYSATKGTVNLNQETVEHFDRERLSKRKDKQSKSSSKKVKVTNQIYDITTIEQALDQDAAEQLLDAYSTPGTKPIQKRQLTPDNSYTNKRIATLGRSPAVAAPFSPASFSPASATPSKKYASRSNAGDVVASYGPADNAKWLGSNRACSVSAYDSSVSLNAKFKYMFQKLTDKAHILNDTIEEMGSLLQKYHNIEEFSHVGLPAQEPVTVVGRICCDSNGKLNAKSVLLEGSRETSAGRHIPVDLTNLPQYSLFPGQIVCMDGINSSGSKFVAQKLYAGYQPPLPSTTPTLDHNLSLLMAAGPFTTSDSLAYEPLTDLVSVLQRDKPDVAVLMGPFVDSKNQELEKLTDLTYEELFNKQMELVALATEKLSTQIVVVPSQRDIHHEPVYPQPPFVLGKKAEQKHIHLKSDPCTLTLDGVVIGITSTDVLFHLGAEEISSPPGSSDRLARLTEHILTQRSYYPLYPSADDVSMDHDNAEMFAHLPVTPHVLIVPSDLRYFIKNVKGCCCINPGRLTKGQVGGTYARLTIKPTNDNSPSLSLVNNIAGQILRI